MTIKIELSVEFASKDQTKKFMFSQNLTLSEFVCPIPVCQPEADLGSILHIFHQSDCDCLAVLNKDLRWGIISSSKLLALLSNPRRQLSTITSGYPKQTYSSRNLASQTDCVELRHLIEPAIVYRDDTKLPNFLASLADNYLESDRSNCLIVDRAGKLKGKLDRHKLLRYIGSRVARCNSNSLLPTSSMPLLSLLDHLNLPLKIETSEGKNCYENRCWQESISHNHDNHLAESQKLNASIADWWMNQQLAAIEKPDGGYFCYLSDKPKLKNSSHNGMAKVRHHNSPQFNARLSAACSVVKQPSIKCSQAQTKTSPNNLPTEQTNCSSLGVKVEATEDWNYIKIPLTLEKSSSNRPTYWSILAIKPSLLQFGKRPAADTKARCHAACRKSKDLSATDPSVSQAQNCDVVDNLTVNNLLRAIGHELKSPLTGILGLSNLLDSQKLGELNPRQAEYIKLIHNSGQELMTVVQGLIELTNLTTGKFELQLEEIELESLFNHLYQQTIAKLQTIDRAESNLLISTSGIKLNIEPELEIAIADRLRLWSILSHLMLETVRFSGASSIAIEIEVRSEGEYMAITIQNKRENGKACSPEAENGDWAARNMGLDSIIALFLARVLQGDLQSVYGSTGCMFTLLLPKVDLPTETSSISARSLEKNMRQSPSEIRRSSGNGGKAKLCDTPLSAGSHRKVTANRHNAVKNLTILCLYPETEAIDRDLGNNHELGFNLKNWAEQDWSDDKKQKFPYRHRIIEADGLEQAHTLARIWQLDVIVLDGYQIVDPQQYWRSLQESQYLSALPIITLDAKTTEAANQVEGLNVYPCLLPAQCRSIRDLMQVIQIATEQ